MVYVTKMQAPMYKQVSIEDLLYGAPDQTYLISRNISNTRTVEMEHVTEKLAASVDCAKLTKRLIEFNEQTEYLRGVERRSLYHTFPIPKKTGGFRKISQPNDDLMNALRVLKRILEVDFGALYHTNAFAYIPHRSTLSALKRHQANESKWFSKFDFSDFFGSTTLDFVMSMMAMIFPFSEVVKYPAGREALEKALELGLLDGGLPQGTPLSPTLTNIMMIPFDYRLTKKLKNESNAYVYTRYADDTLISSKYEFKVREIEKLITDTLKELSAPFMIKKEKTRYGSSAGSNWNLGLMLNKDNQITVGAKRKREFRCALHNYVLDRKNGNKYDLDDIRTTLGLYSYYRMVERETVDGIVAAVNKKMGVDVIAMMKADIA